MEKSCYLELTKAAGIIKYKVECQRKSLVELASANTRRYYKVDSDFESHYDGRFFYNCGELIKIQFVDQSECH